MGKDTRLAFDRGAIHNGKESGTRGVGQMNRKGVAGKGNSIQQHKEARNPRHLCCTVLSNLLSLQHKGGTKVVMVNFICQLNEAGYTVLNIWSNIILDVSVRFLDDINI